MALIVSSISYPLGTGRFIAGELSTHEQVHQLFTNFTWTASELTVEQATIVNYWSTEYTDVFFHLSAFMLFTVNRVQSSQRTGLPTSKVFGKILIGFFFQFVFSIIGSTIPVPSGMFIPVFKIGAALGRIVGEVLHLYFPMGIRYGGRISQIIPGNQV